MYCRSVSVVLLALGLPTLASAADPWHEPTYQQRIRIGLETQRPGSYDQIPVRVNIDNSWFDYSNLSPDGYDIAFYSSNGIRLDFEIEDWQQGGLSEVWVRTNNLADGEYIYMYFEAGYGGDPSSGPDVWDPGSYMPVYHFTNFSNRDRWADSSSWYNDLMPGYSGPPPSPDIGFVSEGLDFGNGDMVRAQSEWVWMGDGFTAMAWMWPQNGQSTNCSNTVGLSGMDNAGSQGVQIGCVSSGGQMGVGASGWDLFGYPPQDVYGGWHFYVFTRDFGGYWKVYQDGELFLEDWDYGGYQSGQYNDVGINERDGRLGFVDEFRTIPDPVGMDQDWVWVEWMAQSGQATIPCPGGPQTWYIDYDADTYGEAGAPIITCVERQGYVAIGGDCNDLDPSINLDASEICGDNQDNDCDGLVDGNDPDTPQNQYWKDSDGDGYGNPLADTFDCQQPSGYVTNSNDCDDTNNTVNPSMAEQCDDLGLDEDCNGFANVSDPAMPKNDYWRDADNDGFGKGSKVTDCKQPTGWIDNPDDCDDTRNDINPAAPEVCDSARDDEDCDGFANADDSDLPTQTYYDDTDGDTYGDASVTQTDCAQPLGYVANGEDCAPGNANVHPGAQEICNTIDDDCDGLVDVDDPTLDASQLGTFYQDSDGDGLGNDTVTQESCEQPVGYITVGGDCDDTDNTVLGASSWFRDADGDTYGDPATSQQACTRPSGFVADKADCDDTDAQENPGAKWYRDSDGDSFGDTTDSLTQCSRPAGYIATLGDCNDSNAAVNPNTTWLEDADGDGYGNDASSVVQCPQPPSHVLPGGDCDDTDSALNPATTWYRDGDGDGYGNPADKLVQCSQPSGYVLNPWDCDDSDAAVLPDAWWYPDSDGDGFGDADAGIQACDPPTGYVSDDTDCDDDRASVNPATRWYEDADGDTFGSTVAYPTLQCAQPSGYVLTSSDCDDTDEQVNPNTVWFFDADGDTYGDPDQSIAQCAPISGYVINGWDCDDTDSSIIPDTVWYFDYDGDGYGDSTNLIQACEALEGYALAEGDCNDSDPFVYPGAGDQCGDGIDTDCDGTGGPDDDEDGDGLSWTDEFGFSDPCEADTDGDSVSDGDEYGLDTDGDGQRDIQDTDDDGDGVPTAQEAGQDSDGDGVDDNLDTDDDGDGTLTIDEDFDLDGNPINDDPDGDGIPAYLDPDEPNVPDIDTDGDGILDSVEEELGSDPNSPDSDGDGIDDADEIGDSGNPTDTDGDGIPDIIDEDDDGDGVNTTEEGSGDTDGDDVPDYLDTDSDNDGSSDGVDPERLDAGGDGADAAIPDAEVNYGFGCSSTGGSTGWLVVGLVALGMRRRR